MDTKYDEERSFYEVYYLSNEDMEKLLTVKDSTLYRLIFPIPYNHYKDFILANNDIAHRLNYIDYKSGFELYLKGE